MIAPLLSEFDLRYRGALNECACTHAAARSAYGETVRQGDGCEMIGSTLLGYEALSLCVLSALTCYRAPSTALSKGAWRRTCPWPWVGVQRTSSQVWIRFSNLRCARVIAGGAPDAEQARGPGHGAERAVEVERVARAPWCKMKLARAGSRSLSCSTLTARGTCQSGARTRCRTRTRRGRAGPSRCSGGSSLACCRPAGVSQRARASSPR